MLISIHFGEIVKNLNSNNLYIDCCRVIDCSDHLNFLKSCCKLIDCVHFSDFQCIHFSRFVVTNFEHRGTIPFAKCSDKFESLLELLVLDATHYASKNCKFYKPFLNFVLSTESKSVY